MWGAGLAKPLTHKNFPNCYELKSVWENKVTLQTTHDNNKRPKSSRFFFFFFFDRDGKKKKKTSLG